jgi:hypothetical protein
MKKCAYCGREYPDEASVCALDREPLTSDAPPAPTPGLPGAQTEADTTEPPRELTEEGEEGNTPAGYCRLGLYDALEADRLLKQFQESNIHFQIDRIERRVPSGRGGYRTIGLIEIFIQNEDQERANKIRIADWKV